MGDEVLGLRVHEAEGKRYIWDAARARWAQIEDGYLSRIDLASAARYLQIARYERDPAKEEDTIVWHPISEEEWKAAPSWTTTPWDSISLALEGGLERVLLYGPPGVGKSYTPWSFSQQKGMEFLSVTMTEMTPMSELRGHFLLKDTSTVWHDGICSRAWRLSGERKVMMVINEIDQAGMDSMTFLHNFLDDQEMAAIHLPTGEVLRPTPGNIQVVATMNGIPEDLPSALRDRFTVQQSIVAPHPEALKSLPDWAQRWVVAAYREAHDDGTPAVPTFRQAKQMVELIGKGFHSTTAASLVFPEGDSHQAALVVLSEVDHVW